MALPLEQFVKQLEDSGVLAAETLKDFIPPIASPKDAEELARELVRQKKLTKFQAEELWRGKGKSLVLGNYVLMGKIGAGGMGQVFKARHRVMERQVAVKVLPAAMTRDKAAIARFHREVQAAARLRHPNIIAADDADFANGVHFLVMEYVEGSDLSALVKQNGRFPVAQAVNYILQAAKGLEYAHAEGIVHRDIKPANLLLDKKGTIKILDMGLARIGGDASGQAELTATGAIMGTVDFMAPEQALNTKGADARADIYSLGCSLFYLLTGKATFNGDTLMAKLLAHRGQPIPSLRTERVEVPEQVDVIFCKMVAKKVEDRYQTMTEVIAALEQCGQGQDLSAGSSPSLVLDLDLGLETFLNDIPAIPASTPQPSKSAVPDKSGKKNKKFVFAGVGAAALGVAILAGVIVLIMDKPGQDETGSKRAKRGSAEVQASRSPTKRDATRVRADGSPVPTPSTPVKKTSTLTSAGIDLLPLVRIDTTIDSSPWQRNSRGVTIVNGGCCRSLIDFNPPDEYELRLDVLPIEGMHSVVVGLSRAGQRFWIPVSGWGEAMTKFEPAPPQGIGNSTVSSTALRLMANQPARLVFTVRRNRVTVVGDGKTLLDWRGDSTSIPEWSVWQAPEPSKLAIGAWRSEMRLTRMELRPIP